jgi:hypothetical protein
MSNFIIQKFIFLASKNYTVKNPKMDSIMDTKVFHSSLQMPQH